MAKSNISFSRNVDKTLAGQILGIVGFQRMGNIGKYLGVSSIHGKVTTGLFNPTLHRINKKLEGWKTKYSAFIENF